MFNHTTKSGTQIIQLLAGRCNVFAVVAPNKKALVVDTSTRPNQEALFSKLDELVQSGVIIEACLLTHTHFDHAGNVNALVETYDTSLYCHECEVPLVLKGQNPRVQGTKGFLKVATTLFQPLLLKIGTYPAVVSPQRCSKNLDLKHIDESIVVISTPGHSDGSVSVIVDGEVALVGDVMVGTSADTIYPPFATNRKAVLQSWQNLLDTGCKVYLPSHGKPVAAQRLSEQLQIESK